MEQIEVEKNNASPTKSYSRSILDPEVKLVSVAKKKKLSQKTSKQI